ncbi:hypothetical protein [Kineococcus sp. SYSU DK001]|uniref:hypothetical protein n=1 Tax=Kineococcus sp. SYSU DK001 TaxID=3383122 RepID=UPI003D7F000C
MVTLFLSLAVIVVVAGVVGHLCSASRPGDRRLGPAAPSRRDRSHISWPGVLGGDSGASGGYVNLPGTHHHHHAGGWGWGGDSSGFGGDSGGGGGGGD